MDDFEIDDGIATLPELEFYIAAHMESADEERKADLEWLREYGTSAIISGRRVSGRVLRVTCPRCGTEGLRAPELDPGQKRAYEASAREKRLLAERARRLADQALELVSASPTEEKVAAAQKMDREALALAESAEATAKAAEEAERFLPHIETHGCYTAKEKDEMARIEAEVAARARS